MPDGLDTDLGQGGVNVSGGQKQRLCIARAILKKPKVLILDDSTSAVDTATDAKIRQAFASGLRDTTKLIIAQRVASVQEADLILVMGGTNDGFCMNQEELGTMQERKPRTFIGDLDELLKGLKENYPQAKVVLVTPLPNVLHDILRKERDYLLPQKTIVSTMKTLAGEYGIPVIDLYNSNILDTHDAAVIYNYMPDGVHCNADGYTLLAEHLGAELIRLYQDGEDGR